MGDLTKNFSRHEFTCKCGKCGLNTVDYELLQNLQQLRDSVGRVHVVSGFRCKDHNEKVGGSVRSQHLYGKAADIWVDGMTPAQVFDLLCYNFKGKYGIGLYMTFVHFDVRSFQARWIEA